MFIRDANVRINVEGIQEMQVLVNQLYGLKTVSLNDLRRRTLFSKRQS